MNGQHLYKSPTIEVYTWSLQITITLTERFFCQPGLKNSWRGQPEIGPTTLDLCAFDVSATATKL